jgi:divalent metal cation (Fe/Co/Zn/Cd) transporter
VSTTAAARRAAPIAAIALGLVNLVIGMATVPLDSLIHQAGTGGPLTDTLTNAAAVVPATAVGTLLAARRPRNPIGWLLLGIIIVGFSPTSQYLILDYRMRHGTLPLGGAAVILNETWPLLLCFVSILLWIFPDGTLPPGRWHRRAVVLLVAGLVIALAASTSGVLAVAGHYVRIQANGDLGGHRPEALVVLFVAVIAATLISWLAWVVLQVPTYRHASGERRQQLKWLYSGAAILVVSLVIGVFIVPLAMGEAPGYGTQPVVGALTTIGTGALPVGMGVAVLKYRLYELNRLISRVVSYALITALLGGMFFGTVLLVTRVLPFRTTVGVAVSTLVIAALFNPLRKRVQNLVDRRFNRSRYDAEAIVAAFTARLRHTVDLDTVREDLLGATESAFQPTHVSVWIASAGTERPTLAGA